MGYYAKIVNGVVDKVMVADAAFFDMFVDDSPGTWLETSLTGEIRKNYAGRGMLYDSTRDAFMYSQPYSSWTLNEDTCLWEPPVPYPSGDAYHTWDENTRTWKEEK